ncbi:MAG TPA: hypothetical protein VFC84_18310 [Desulfosporosinus sp.]|nr:hypothetical protein [Desulfosporosinus sp.]
MTMRSVLTTQRKLASKLLSLGNGVPARLTILGSVGGSSHHVRCPVFGVAYSEFAILLT